MQWLSDSRFESITRLGLCHRLYKGSVIYRVIAVLLGSMMLLPLAFHLIQRQAGGIGGEADMAFSLVGAPLVFWLVWRRCSDTVAVYDGGIACAGRGGVLGGMLEIRWEEISNLRETVATLRAGEEEVRQVRELFIETRDGKRVDLLGLEDIEELWDEIGRNVARAVLSDRVAQVEAGRPLSFGPFRVSAQGVGRTVKGEDQIVAWAGIHSVRQEPGNLSLYPRIAVEVQPGYPSETDTWACELRSQVPNVHTFIALCNHFMDAERSR